MPSLHLKKELPNVEGISTNNKEAAVYFGPRNGGGIGTHRSAPGLDRLDGGSPAYI